MFAIGDRVLWYMDAAYMLLNNRGIGTVIDYDALRQIYTVKWADSHTTLCDHNDLVKAEA